MALHPVILCGGSGTRLWPSSRHDRPKQFLHLVAPRSSFQETLLRVQGLPDAATAVVVTGAGQLDHVLTQAAEVGVDITVLVEPEARDSAPAIAAAAAYVQAQDADGVVLMLAADHHIRNAAGFRDSAAVAAEAAKAGAIVTFGVPPSGPATGYGYIRPGEALSDRVLRVAAFVEKPDRTTAERYVADGYLWNSGNFAFEAKTLLGEFAAFEPAVAASGSAAVAEARVEGRVLRLDGAAFVRAPKISLDYAVMEHTARAAVTPAAFDWSDLGAWDAIWEASERDSAGNAVLGDVSLLESRNTLVRSTGPFVSVVGMEDCVVVAEPDAVLVCHLSKSQAVKAVVDGLKMEGRSIATHHAETIEGGVSRRELAQEEAAIVELWHVADDVEVEVPAGVALVLAGSLKGEADAPTVGSRLDLPAPAVFRATADACLLVTRWR